MEAATSPANQVLLSTTESASELAAKKDGNSKDIIVSEPDVLLDIL